MASLSYTLMVLIAALGLINGVPVTKVTTKTTKVTSSGTHVTTHANVPFHTSSTSISQTHFPYIYGASDPTHVTSVNSHPLSPYPYVYGWGPSTQQASTSPVAQPSPYPYMYGWPSPYQQYMPNYGLPYGYPSPYLSGFPSGRFGGFPGYY